MEGQIALQMEKEKKETVYRSLQVRYMKLYFTLEFSGNAILPRDKVSALRGGMGEMLLRANCIRDRNCSQCDFSQECIVQRTMYSQFDYKPNYITTGDSIGYVLECEDDRERFIRGDKLDFQLILFGKTIVYFNQYLQALHALGMQGLGKNHAHFKIVSVLNSDRQQILYANSVYMENYRVKTLMDYVEERRKRLPQGMDSLVLSFQTPATIKFHNDFLKEFQAEAVIMAVRRRIYMLDCFEGIASDVNVADFEELPILNGQEAVGAEVNRYSNRQGSRMTLRGIKGWMRLSHVNEENLLLLLAGELIHVGKNTSFGFGRYLVNGC